MGSQRGASWEQPKHKVSTPEFELGTRPVSNAEFREFRPSHRSPGDDSDDSPVTGVSWFDAQAYCGWLSERTGRRFVLPPEAWWEKAVRGGLEQRTYPWGDESPVSEGSSPTTTAAPPRANPLGIFAITYNLWEWSADWYAADYFAKSPSDDPRGPKDGEFRVLRGGGFRGDPASATCFSRGSARPETVSPYITFRVAVDPAEPPVVSQAKPEPPPAPAPAAARAEPRPAPPAAPAAAAAEVERPATKARSEPLEVGGFELEDTASQLVLKITTNDAAEFKTLQLTGPDRLVIDLPMAKLGIGGGAGELKVDKRGVRKVRYSQFQIDPPMVRVVVDMDSKLDFQIESWPTELRVILRP